VQVAERQVAIREQQVRIARSGYLPSLDLTVNYARTAFPAGVLELSGQEWRTDFTAAVGLRVPIFSGFRTGADVQEAQINLLSERLRLAQLRENVELQYQQALGEKQRAAAEITARQRTVEQAQRVYDLTVLRYGQGLATQLEVTDARLGALQARTNLAQAVSGFYLAEAGVSRSLGTPMATPVEGPPSAAPGTPPAAATRPPATPTPAPTVPRTPATPPTPPAPRAP
jgi:outer membrane protein TolC